MEYLNECIAIPSFTGETEESHNKSYRVLPDRKYYYKPIVEIYAFLLAFLVLKNKKD